MSCTGGYLDLDANNFSPILSLKMDRKQYKSLVFLRSRPHYKLSKPRAPLWNVIWGLARCGQVPATLWIKLWVQKLMAGKCILLWNSVISTSNLRPSQDSRRRLADGGGLSAQLLGSRPSRPSRRRRMEGGLGSRRTHGIRLLLRSERDGQVEIGFCLQN